MEARAGIEPAIKVLQTSALPLGYLAVSDRAETGKRMLGVVGGMSTVSVTGVEVLGVPRVEGGHIKGESSPIPLRWDRGRVGEVTAQAELRCPLEGAFRAEGLDGDFDSAVLGLFFGGAFGDEGLGFAEAFDFDAGGVEAECVEEPVSDGGGSVDAEGEVVLVVADGVCVSFEDEFGVFALHDEGAQLHEAEPGFVFEFGAVEGEEDIGGDPDGFAGIAFAFHAEYLVEACIAVRDEITGAISASASGEIGEVRGVVVRATEEVADVHFRVVRVERFGAFVHALKDLGDVLGGIAGVVGRIGEAFGFGSGSVEGDVLDRFDGRGHLDLGVDEEVGRDVVGGEFGEFGDFVGRFW